MLPEPLNYRGAKAEIARVCSLKKQTVSGWKTIPSRHVLTIARAFEIAPERLLPSPAAAAPAERPRGLRRKCVPCACAAQAAKPRAVLPVGQARALAAAEEGGRR